MTIYSKEKKTTIPCKPNKNTPVYVWTSNFKYDTQELTKKKLEEILGVIFVTKVVEVITY